MKLKTCKRCSSAKPLGEFQTNSRRADGHADTCSACVKRVKAQSMARRFEPYGVGAEYHRFVCGHVV